jgi:hypothetical protein
MGSICKSWVSRNVEHKLRWPPCYSLILSFLFLLCLSRWILRIHPTAVGPSPLAKILASPQDNSTAGSGDHLPNAAGGGLSTIANWCNQMSREPGCMSLAGCRREGMCGSALVSRGMLHGATPENGRQHALELEHGHDRRECETRIGAERDLEECSFRIGCSPQTITMAGDTRQGAEASYYSMASDSRSRAGRVRL